MSYEKRTQPGTFRKTTIRLSLAVVVLTLAAVSGAEAVCIDKTAGALTGKSVAPRFNSGLNGGISQAEASEDEVSMVGLWQVDFLLDNGDPYDQGFEQWHADGTELTLDNAVAPAFGNICLGVWKRVGPRSVRLTHVGWNWDVNQKVAGTFWLWMTATVDRRGRTFSGTFKTDSYDRDGNVIPELHAEGTVRGVRIPVD